MQQKVTNPFPGLEGSANASFSNVESYDLPPILCAPAIFFLKAMSAVPSAGNFFTMALYSQLV